MVSLLRLLFGGTAISSFLFNLVASAEPVYLPEPLIGTQAETTWAASATQRVLDTALGLPAIAYPADNPPTPEKVALGRKLFFDRRLSFNKTMSCAMCHVPEQAFSSWEMQTSVGVEGRSGKRNAPTILNVGFYKTLFTDGRETSLETQFISPLIARNEMANPSAGYLVTKLKSLPDYNGLFEEAFGKSASLDRIGMALGVYQRSLVAGNSPFDQWYYGNDKKAISDKAARGFQLFKKQANCTTCHIINEDYAIFTDNNFHDIGYGWWRERKRQNPPETTSVEIAPGEYIQVDKATITSVGDPPQSDLGRYEVTEDPEDLWKFRTPSLRNVGVTMPYMHDGGFSTLRDVLEFYNAGAVPHDGLHPALKPLGLSSGDLADIEAFLHSLTSSTISTLIGEARYQAPDNH